MSLSTVALNAPTDITARFCWNPATSVHDRRRILAREIVASLLGCDESEIRVDREAPRGFGYHRRLIATRGGAELPLTIATASHGAATVVAACDPVHTIGLDIRDLHPDPHDLAVMRRHSHLPDEADVHGLLDHWTRVQAILDADARGTRVAPERVRLDYGRRSGRLSDRAAIFDLTDVSTGTWVITIAHARPATAPR